eukprot:m.74088 g.74088  ORF g.74088 m.74088 type:complete len:802 (-) comp14488_c1_seq24:183-2588(-)
MNREVVRWRFIGSEDELQRTLRYHGKPVPGPHHLRLSRSVPPRCFNHALRVLTSADLSSNNLGVRGAEAIAAGLLNNITLTTLNISWNDIGDDGATIIAESMLDNRTISSLSLSGNNIKSVGGHAIAVLLSKNRVVQWADLSYNKLDDMNGRELGKVLQNNSRIRQLNLDGNNFSMEVWMIIHSAAAAQGVQVKEKPDNRSKQRKVNASLAARYGTVPVTQFPLFICGFQEVGKTTLSHTLERSKMPDNEPSTRGVATRPVTINGCEFSIWDYAGEMEYYSCHEFFLLPSSHAVFLVCVRGNQSVAKATQELQYWLRFIRSRIPPKQMEANADQSEVKMARVLLVVTHMDEVAAREVSTLTAAMEREADAAKASFAHVLDVDKEPLFVVAPSTVFFGIDFTRNAGVVQLRRKLVAAHAAICEQNPQVPKICVKVLQTLRRLRQDHKAFPVVPLAKCFEFDTYILPYYQSKVLKYLHSIGEVFWLDREDARDLIVIDVSWIGNFILGELLKPKEDVGDSMQADSSGHLTKEQLARRLTLQDEAQRPVLDFVIDVLKQLGLCYQSSRDVFLFPQLLPASAASVLEVMGETAGPHVQQWRLACVQGNALMRTEMLTAGVMPMLQTRVLQELGAEGNTFSHHRLVLKKGGMTIGVEQDAAGQELNIFLTPADEPIAPRAQVLETLRWFFNMLVKVLATCCPGTTLELQAGAGDRYVALRKLVAESVVNRRMASLDYTDVNGMCDVLTSFIPWWLYDLAVAEPSPESVICSLIDARNQEWRAFVDKCLEARRLQGRRRINPPPAAD